MRIYCLPPPLADLVPAWKSQDSTILWASRASLECFVFGERSCGNRRVQSLNVSQALPESGQRRCGELGRQSFTIVPKQPKTKQPTSTLLDQAGKEDPHRYEQLEARILALEASDWVHSDGNSFQTSAARLSLFLRMSSGCFLLFHVVNVCQCGNLEGSWQIQAAYAGGFTRAARGRHTKIQCDSVFRCICS